MFARESSQLMHSFIVKIEKLFDRICSFFVLFVEVESAMIYFQKNFHIQHALENSAREILSEKFWLGIRNIIENNLNHQQLQVKFFLSPF